MGHLEAKVKNQVAEIFKDKSFVRCSYIGRNIVRGFTGYITYLGLGQSTISSGLFDGDILSHLVVDGPLAEDSINHGIDIIAGAVGEHFGVNPAKISKELLADIGPEIAQIYENLALLVYRLVMQKNYQTLGTASANQPETEPNIDLGEREKELELIVFARSNNNLSFYLNRN